MNKNNITEIKRPAIGNAAFIAVCSLFVIALVIIYFASEQNVEDLLFAGFGIAFFGGGGLLFVIFQMRKPLVVMCSKGITVPHGWKESFVPWEDVERIETITQSAGRTKIKHVAVYAPNAKGVAGSDAVSQTITESVTGWDEAPTLLIPTSFIFRKPEYIAQTLRDAHERYGIQ